MITTRDRGRAWTDLEIRVVEGRPDLTNEELAEALARTVPAVALMRARLRGGHRRRIWTAEDDDRLRELADLPIREQAEAMGRTVAAICTRRNDIGISASQHQRPWLARDAAALAGMTLAEARAAHPDRTPASVYAARWKAKNRPRLP